MHSITAMLAYEFEELRLEDYLAGNRGQRGKLLSPISQYAIALTLHKLISLESMA